MESMVSEAHAIEVSEPMVAGNTFAIPCAGHDHEEQKTKDMTELCVYNVKTVK